MRKTVGVLFTLLLSLPLFGQDFKIDTGHSSANFAVKHLLVSTVRGRFGGGVSGTIHYDANDITKSWVQAVVKTDTVDTDNSSRDKDLRGPNFFEVEKYPEMRFESTRIEKRGDEYIAIGNLTIKDVTKQVELPFSLTTGEAKGKKRLGVDASLTLNRLEYHINYDPSGTTVGKQVKVDLNLEAVEQ